MERSPRKVQLKKSILNSSKLQNSQDSPFKRRLRKQSTYLEEHDEDPSNEVSDPMNPDIELLSEILSQQNIEEIVEESKSRKNTKINTEATKPTVDTEPLNTSSESSSTSSESEPTNQQQTVWKEAGKDSLRRRKTLSDQKFVMGGSFNSLKMNRLNKLENQIKTKLEGFLEKKGDIGVTKAWKKRYFVLNGSQLWYYRDIPEKDSEPINFIPLLNATSIEAFPGKKPGCFQIATSEPNRIWYLRASSDEQMRKWLDACIFHSVSSSLNAQKQISSLKQNNRAITTIFGSSANLKRSREDKDRRKLEMKRYVVFSKEHYGELVQIFSYDKFFLLKTLCNFCDSEELAQTIIGIYYKENQEENEVILQFIEEMLIQSWYSKDDKSKEIFLRRDTMAIRVIRNYFRLVGEEYLKETIYPTLQRILKEHLEVEIDPLKVPQEKIQGNLIRLTQLAQQFFDSILRSLPNLPMSQVLLFQRMKNFLQSRSPHSVELIGSFFFLRIICPAIITPHLWFDEIDSITPEERRAFVLVCKLLQNLANKEEFNEDFMKPCTPFLTKNAKALSEFYTNLLKEGKTSQKKESKEPTEQEKIELVSLIIALFSRNWDQIYSFVKADIRIQNNFQHVVKREFFFLYF